MDLPNSDDCFNRISEKGVTIKSPPFSSLTNVKFICLNFSTFVYFFAGALSRPLPDRWPSFLAGQLGGRRVLSLELPFLPDFDLDIIFTSKNVFENCVKRFY